MGINNCNAQTHYPISQFTDTLEYLNKNYVCQKEYFIGKKFKVLADAIKSDIVIKDIWTMPSRFYDKDKGDGNMWVKGLALSWLTGQECKRLYNINPEKDTSILVVFEYPYSELDYEYYTFKFTIDQILSNFENHIIKEISLL